MSQKIKQQMSAFIDGDKDSVDVVDKLKQDKELESAFGRYHMIGDAMRNELPEQIHLDIADAVAQAIDKEPVVLAPNTAFTQAVNESESKDKAANDEGIRAKVVSLFKPVAQYGLAASFAAAMVVGFQAEQADVPVTEPALFTTPIGGALNPVSMERTVPVSYPNQVQQEQRRMVQSYILDHTQQLKTRPHHEVQASDADSAQESVNTPNSTNN